MANFINVSFYPVCAESFSHSWLLVTKIYKERVAVPVPTNPVTSSAVTYPDYKTGLGIFGCFTVWLSDLQYVIQTYFPGWSSSLLSSRPSVTVQSYAPCLGMLIQGQFSVGE